MPVRRSAAVQKARAILDGTRTDAQPAEVLQLVDTLRREYKFDYARRVLNKIRPGIAADHPLRIKLGQQHALCTYKDIDIPVERRLERALRILRSVDDPDAPEAMQETLGLAGSIWKRRWEVTGRKQDLERSLAYYEAGAAKGIAPDYGYTAINAAFVLDLLAREEERMVPTVPAAVASAEERRGAATAHRNAIIAVLDAANRAKDPMAAKWWFAATLAEAQFGLGRYDEADRTLAAALEHGRSEEWERESTTQQFAALARLQAGESATDLVRSRAWQVVGRLLGADATGLRGQLAGKMGLALSGGGFRAALFHIGVLARLAELDLLRHVEVISCVSGGSIVGTHYYLKLKQLLERVPDKEISAQDYVKLVGDLERDFLAGVQRNIRTRLLAEPGTHVRMWFERGFTWTKRAGELFEEEIFSRMKGDGSVTARRVMLMKDLLVTPKDEQPDFHPLRHNWRRRAKLPVLVLNATTLNTGHGWQFTATWMGEPPVDVEEDHDVTYRLRRLYHDEAPEPYATESPVRLGHAVAASAAVPGLFDPVDLPALYEHKPEKDGGRPTPIRVRLVDGGVYDNQGVASLTDQDCRVQLVSDASGQLEDIDQPKAGPLPVLLRSGSIQGARVRLAQFDTLAARRPQSIDRPFVVHLKSNLGIEYVDWRGCDEPHHLFGDFSVEAAPRPVDRDRTNYGVRRSAQALLATVRTDLDTFSDAEAYALMLSGYRMTTENVRASGLQRLAGPEIEGRWAFRRIAHALTHASSSDALAGRLDMHLRAATKRFFKVWKTDPVLRAVKWPLRVAAAALAGYLLFRYRATVLPIPRPTLGDIGMLALVTVAGLLGIGVVKKVRAVINFEKTLVQYGASLALAAGGFLVARGHLWIFDRIFLKRGAIGNFEQPPVQAPPGALAAGEDRRATAPRPAPGGEPARMR